MNHLFLHCRAGFEKECAAEIADIAAGQGLYGYSKTVEGSAYVLFVTHEPEGALSLMQDIRFRDLIFVRQWFATAPVVNDLPVTDRVTPLLVLAQTLPACRELIIETVDTNDGKALSGLSKKFLRPFELALKKQQCLNPASQWRLHLVFLSGTQACLGISPVHNSASWPMGIPRLRLPRDAPSRATLKLEEAWHHFIPAAEWDQRLAYSMRAVDLGAAPGGWTWQLVQRGMFVDAVDNGPMARSVMDTGQVRHQQADGFLYEPRKPVDWLVCDIVDKPARVASLISKWAGKGYCREAIFNLKLPMKQRYAEVKKCEQRLYSDLNALGLDVDIRFKQLYHDREEVTAHLRVY